MTVASKPDGRVARREGTREVIMAAATDLFAARGVTSTSIDDIAEAAGIAKGSIYYNFESKAGWSRRSWPQQRVAHRSAGQGRGRTPRPRTAGAVVTELLELLRAHPGGARVLVTELFRTERSWREAIANWRGLAWRPDRRPAGQRGPADRAQLRAAAIVGATLTAGWNGWCSIRNWS